MKPHIIISPKATRDLIRIATYTDKQWGQKQRKKYLEQLKTRIQKLAKTPTLGRQHHELPESPYGYNEGRHVIFYRLTAHGIEIIRVLHDAMDFIQHFT
jgi:toxin ParE1/3/4